MNRRNFLKTGLKLGIGAYLYPLTHSLASMPGKKFKYIVMGIDGMDVHLVNAYMNRNLLPNLQRLASIGGFSPVRSTFPPQSPVAWSSFSVGAPPALHGIYDFIHRDPSSMMPYLSTSRVISAQKTLDLFQWKIPLVAGRVENLRKGRPFWEYLADYDIPATIFKMPGNFPCQSDRVDMVSGMGTPDLRGGYGSFTLFTSLVPENADEITGGIVVPIDFRDNTADTVLEGPRNTLREGQPVEKIPVRIWRDRKNSVARIRIQENEFLLRQGEWTGWISLSFTMIPYFSEVKGLCKVYIKSIYPEFNMYVSPINMDPSNPALPVISSSAYGKELVRNVGPFYTQGLPEDTKALSYDILDDTEYLNLAFQVIRERNRLFEFELKRFARQDTGFLFFYFSSLDQDTHMFWRAVDEAHPLYSPGLNRKYGSVIKQIYMEMDKSIGKALDTIDISDPNVKLVVMSDHGFAPFRRQVNINSWLCEKGYMDRPLRLGDSNGFFDKVNWNRTAAYALGINSLYLNLSGRERFGSVHPSQAKELRGSLKKDLFALVDEKTGQLAVSNVKIISDHERRMNPDSPDMIIGWNRGYRTSWDGILGGFSKEIISDNDNKWSGDHCIDSRLVPAVLFSNKKILNNRPALWDITADVLTEFGIPIPAEMEGKPL